MREKKPKVGRPPLPKGEAKGIVLQSRVQPSEKTVVSKGSQVRRKDLSTWIRETLNQAIKGDSLDGGGRGNRTRRCGNSAPWVVTAFNNTSHRTPSKEAKALSNQGFCFWWPSYS